MARARSGRLAAALLTISLGAGCTPTVHRLEPYRDDPSKAGELERQATERCQERRGNELPPHPFTTDGCSLWPDGTWVSCCVQHDMEYWCGGRCEDRERADQALQQCVVDSGPTGMGTTMYLGVRIGGPPWAPFPFRWGYGWDWPRGYDSEPEKRDPPQSAARCGGCASLTRRESGGRSESAAPR